MRDRLKALSGLSQFAGTIAGVFVAIACWYYFLAPVLWHYQQDHAALHVIINMVNQQAAQQQAQQAKKP